MARDLQADQATLRQVLGYAQQRDIRRAAELAEKTLASGFEHPLLLNVLATRHEQEGNFEASCRLLQRAVTLAPRDVAARNALALCLQRLERPAEALAHVEEILKAKDKPDAKSEPKPKPKPAMKRKTRSVSKPKVPKLKAKHP